MALVSPMVIDSSPPNPYRALSVTPPKDAQDTTSTNLSSSDGLVSPSAFLRPARPVVLKSGSRALPLPEGVDTGFTSTGSLWRSKYFDHGLENSGEDDGIAAGSRDNGSGDKAPKKDRTGSGKLVRPKKRTVRRPPTDSDAQDDLERVLRQESSLQKKSPVQGPQQIVPNVHDCVHHEPIKEPVAIPNDSPTSFLARRMIDANISTGSHELGETDPVVVPPRAAKKSSKRVSKPKDPSTKRPARRNSAKKKKSESIIINSDEPDPPQVTEMAHQSPVMDHAPPTTESSVMSHPEKVVTNVAAPDPPLAKAITGLPENMEHTAEKDVPKYIMPAEPPMHVNDSVMTMVADPVPSPKMHADIDMPMEVASRRRRDWTPAKATSEAPKNIAEPQICSPSTTSPTSPRPRLTSVLGDYAYVNCDCDRNTSSMQLDGEAGTKRRRIDLTELPMPIPVAPAKARKEGVSPPKKRGKGPKKPQTITALATAAYRQQNEIGTLDLLPANPTIPNQDPGEGSNVVEPETKPKKTRKPRKSSTATKPAERKTQIPKSGKKANAAKSKPKEIVPREQLYSPSRASAQLRRQDFLFGTSSQLAIEESPTFIRQFQAAIADSELSAPRRYQEAELTSAGPVRSKSSAQVPSAPHGTSLSVEQTDRELWCVSARGRDGGLFRHRHPRAAAPACNPVANPRVTSEKDPTRPLNGINTVQSPTRSSHNEAMATSGPSAAVDLCSSSPIRDPPARHESPTAEIAQQIAPEPVIGECHGSPNPDRVPAKRASEDDSWFVLQSDSPQPPPVVQGPSLVNTNAFHPAATSLDLSIQRNSLSPQRSPLRSLDANAAMVTSASFPGPHVLDQSRAISTSHSLEARKSTPVKRPRGRPLKEAAPVVSPKPSRSASKTSKKKAKTPSPRKKAKSQAAKVSTTSNDKSGWLNVDEISDSDSPATPSPPRRRASSSPPTVQPLDLQSLGATEAPKSILAHPTSFIHPPKPGESWWKQLAADIFPRITATVRKESQDLGNATLQTTWWDKILMYDPIEIEELTDWLNGQGLKVQVRKQKPKPKKKPGRKKKTDDAGTATTTDDNVVEWEVFGEDLKPWMVQKWCEENSTCCLWKENGRRGVIRGRY